MTMANHAPAARIPAARERLRFLSPQQPNWRRECPMSDRLRNCCWGLCLVLAAGLAAPVFAAEAKKPSDKAEGGEGGRPKSDNSPFVVLDPMPISIIRDSSGKGILVVEISLDAKSVPARPEVEHLVPILRDLYIRVLNLYTSRDLHIHQPADALLIKTRLQMATDQVLGPGKATVLMRQVLERRTQ
jgi:flagellar basal body-associated protein FliL